MQPKLDESSQQMNQTKSRFNTVRLPESASVSPVTHCFQDFEKADQAVRQLEQYKVNLDSKTAEINRCVVSGFSSCIYLWRTSYASSGMDMQLSQVRRGLEEKESRVKQLEDRLFIDDITAVESHER